MGKIIKHLDSQDLPTTISKNLPKCPVCKEKTTWKTGAKYSFLWIPQRWITIQCTVCGAEWRYDIQKPIFDMFLGGEMAVTVRFSKIVNDDSIWILRKPSKDSRGENFVNKRIKFSSWKKMARES